MIETLDALEALYGTPSTPAMRKVADRLTPSYRRWIAASRFCVLTTVGPDGTDGSPRGDEGPVAVEIDDKTLALPDWHGNNRLDSLRNIVRDPRVSLMFMVPGSGNVIRVNGRAGISADKEMLARFEKAGKRPRSVILVTISEVYFQCSRAILRSDLWRGDDQSEGLPSPGDILAELTSGEEGGATYDAEWPERARRSIW